MAKHNKPDYWSRATKDMNQAMKQLQDHAAKSFGSDFMRFSNGLHKSLIASEKTITKQSNTFVKTHQNALTLIENHTQMSLKKMSRMYDAYFRSLSDKYKKFNNSVGAHVTPGVVIPTNGPVTPPTPPGPHPPKPPGHHSNNFSEQLKEQLAEMLNLKEAGREILRVIPELIPAIAALGSVAALIKAVVDNLIELDSQGQQVRMLTLGNQEEFYQTMSDINTLSTQFRLSREEVVEFNKALADGITPASKLRESSLELIKPMSQMHHIFGLTVEQSAEYVELLEKNGVHTGEMSHKVDTLVKVMSKLNLTTRDMAASVREGQVAWSQFGGALGISVDTLQKGIAGTKQLFKSMNMDAKESGRVISDLMKSPESIHQQVGFTASVLGRSGEQLEAMAFEHPEEFQKLNMKAGFKAIMGTGRQKENLLNSLTKSPDDWRAELMRGGMSREDAFRRTNSTQESIMRMRKQFSEYDGFDPVKFDGLLSSFRKKYHGKTLMNPDAIMDDFVDQAQKSFQKGAKPKTLQDAIKALDGSINTQFKDLANSINSLISEVSLSLMPALTELVGYLKILIEFIKPMSDFMHMIQDAVTPHGDSSDAVRAMVARQMGLGPLFDMLNAKRSAAALDKKTGVSRLPEALGKANREKLSFFDSLARRAMNPFNAGLGDSGAGIKTPSPIPAPLNASGLGADIFGMATGGASPIAPVKTSMKAGAQDRTAKAMQFFIKNGFSKEQAAGIVGNFLVESAHTMSGGIKEFSGGGGYGIAQWTTPARKRGLAQYAANKGMSVDNLDLQLMYALQEMKDQGLDTKLKGISGANAHQQASTMVMRQFERPLDMAVGGANDLARGKAALEAMGVYERQLKQKPAVATATPVDWRTIKQFSPTGVAPKFAPLPYGAQPQSTALAQPPQPAISQETNEILKQLLACNQKDSATRERLMRELARSTQLNNGDQTAQMGQLIAGGF